MAPAPASDGDNLCKSERWLASQHHVCVLRYRDGQGCPVAGRCRQDGLLLLGQPAQVPVWRYDTAYNL